MEAAIRGALERAGIPGAQQRYRIYDSARAALDRSLERQGVEDAERIAAHRNKLDELIAHIEAEWAPPAVDAPEDALSAGPAAYPGDFVRPVREDPGAGPLDHPPLPGESAPPVDGPPS